MDSSRAGSVPIGATQRASEPSGVKANDTYLFRAEYTTGDKLHTAARLGSTVLGTDENPGELGGAGYTKEWPVERLVRDAKLYDIGAGTNEIRRFLIGRELLGS